MAEDKKYYWIKLRTDFFADDSPMDVLLSQKNGSEYVCLYIKLCLATANKDGRLCNNIGEMLIPYNVEKIQRDMKHFSIDTVRVALELYKKMGLIYEEADGVLSIANHSAMVGSESASREAIKKRDYRNRVKANGGELLGTTKGTEEGTICPTENRDKEIRDKEIREEEKRDREKTKKSAPLYFPDDDLLNAAFADFVEMRKKIKKPLATERAVDLAIKEVNKLSGGDSVKAIAIINQSILRGWQGLFPLKEDKEPERQQPQSIAEKWANAAKGII